MTTEFDGANRKATLETRGFDVAHANEVFDGATGFAQKVVFFADFLCNTHFCTKTRSDSEFEQLKE